MDVCPSCGERVAPDAISCPECDARLEGATAAFEAVAEVSAEPASDQLESSDIPVLVVGKGLEVGERFHLEQPELTIGRDPESDIFLNDVTVSRRHARLLIDQGVVTVEDAGSLNGTYVNDRLVESAVLTNGDSLQIGRFRMAFLTGGGI